MNKNILIIGSARSGKTTLAKKLVREKDYNLISIDDIVSGFEAFPELNIRHNNDLETSTNLTPFLMKYLKELSENTTFYDGIRYVIEGSHIDIDKLIPFLKSAEYKEKYEIIGLTYNEVSPEKMLSDIRKYDTEDDWTYWCSDEELKANIKHFLDRNSYFNEKFKKYDIKTFDVSFNREEVINKIIESL